jgi:hypothetical protein
MTLSGVDVATFTGAVQLNFRRKLALELGVPMSQIKLANIAAVGPGRRLEVGSAIVTFTIIVFAASDSNPAGLETQSEHFAAMVSSETDIADSFQEAYRQSGLLAPVVTVAAATPPIVQVEVLELKCPRGKYYPPGVNSSECLLCGAGTYQDEPGSEYCRTCPTRATTDSGAASAMDCHCAPGYIMVENGTWASGSWTPVERPECRRCMQGANCSIAGTTVKNLVTEPGYWRASVSTTHFDSLSCAFDTCIGGAISARSATAPQRRALQGLSLPSDAQCALGQSGLMCSLCDTDNRYARHMGAKCIKCDNTIKRELARICLVTATMLALALVIYKHVVKPLLRRALQRMTLLQLRKGNPVLSTLFALN